MPWHRIINVSALEKVVWDNWPDFGLNQFMSQSEDRLRLELQNRLPEHSIGPASHVHHHADTVHIILDGEGEYAVAPDVWVPVRAGDIFLTKGGEVHGGRATNPDKPLRYVVIEGPAPEDVDVVSDGRSSASDKAFQEERERRAREDAAAAGELRVLRNGRIAGTNVFLGGPTDRPAWMDALPKGSYTD